MSSIMSLHSLTQDVCAGMPEDILTCKYTAFVISMNLKLTMVDHSAAN